MSKKIQNTNIFEQAIYMILGLVLILIGIQLLPLLIIFFIIPPSRPYVIRLGEMILALLKGEK